jgi:hypothetical protein
MLKEILNLEGVAVLSKEQQKSVNGGYSASVIKATCKDGTLVQVLNCQEAATMACASSGGVKECKDGYPGPFDPPKSSWS